MCVSEFHTHGNFSKSIEKKVPVIYLLTLNESKVSIQH